MSTLTPTTAASIDYFQHLGVEETITRLFHIFGRRWGVFLAITAIAYLLITAISIVSMVVILPLVIQSSQKTSADWYNSNYDDRSTFYIHWIMFSLVNSAIYYAVMCIADGALIRAVAEIYLDHVPTVYDTLLNGLHKLGPLFCTAFLIGAFVGIPAVAIVFIILKAWGSVPGAVLFGVFFAAFVICVTVFTYLAYPIIMVENLGPVTCVFRSFELSFGHRCYIFSILLLFFFAQFVISSLVSSLASHDDYHAYIVSRTLKLVLNIFFASLGSILQAIVYLNVRVQKEGLNRDILAMELFAGNNDAAATASGNEATTPYGTAIDIDQATAAKQSMPDIDNLAELGALRSFD